MTGQISSPNRTAAHPQSDREASVAAFESNIVTPPAGTDGIPHNSPHFTRDDVGELGLVLESGWVATGPRTSALERTLADSLGPSESAECVMVSNGTSALYLALRSAGIGAGSEVLVPNFSCTAISNAVRMTGATPIPVDSDPLDFNMCPGSAGASVTSRTMAFISTGTFGVPSRIAEIADAVQGASKRPVLLFGSIPNPKDSPIYAIEDCAQCIGSFHGRFDSGRWGAGKPAGSVGWCSVFSFHATKLITGGTGGALFSARNSAAAWVRDFIDYDMPGDDRERFNFLPGDIPAALANSQFSRLGMLVGARRFASETYEAVRTGFSWTGTQQCPPGSVPNHYRYVIVMPDRDSRDRALHLFSKAGIGSIGPLLAEELISSHLGLDIDLPVSRRLADTTLSLPVFPGLGPDRVSRIAMTLGEVLSRLENP